MVNRGLINVWCVLYPPPALMGAPLPPLINQLQADRNTACMYTRWGNAHLHLLCLTSVASVFTRFVFFPSSCSLIFFLFPFLVFLVSSCVVPFVCAGLHFSCTTLHPYFFLIVLFPFSLPSPSLHCSFCIPCTVLYNALSVSSPCIMFYFHSVCVAVPFITMMYIYWLVIMWRC